ncbi:MAG: hypothetical protein A49_24740 [Methyloceanibacter sp.]|nr:MAG: hypothetical protein A49_24740 [Methyloceanibacter sp.]
MDSTFKRDANFALAKFGGKATFAGSTFSGEANFASAQFTDEVSFCPLTSPRTGDRSQTEHRSAEPLQPTKFLDHATFEKTCFATLANFEGAQFAKSAAFGGAEFSGPADFDGTCFGWGASFWEVRFKGYGTFRRARFKYTPEMNPYPTQFLAAKCQGGFNLEEATFEEVPNFDQAHFEEGPRLDHIRIPHQSFLDSLKTPGNPERSARYRALKRLAAQGHDHDSEQRFFASELRSRRGNPDRPWPTFGRQETPVRTTDETPTHGVDGIWPGGASYWVGFFYDLFSNFGRSITRPIFLWLLTTSIAAAAYLGRHCLLGKPGCIDGQGSPLGSAVYLALRKGLIFPGLSPDQKLDEAYACLFGTKVPFTGSQHIPIIPNSVTYLGIGQTLFSGVLIFLFFLAIRNQFRIK